MLKNVVLFPGTDAIENPMYRASVINLPRVKSKIRETENIIKNIYQEELDLLSYMTAPNDVSLQGFRKLVFCSLATQVALYENYVDEFGIPDCIMGLSLGDVPRSVVAGLVSLEEGIKSLYLFTAMYNLAEEGMSVHVKLEKSFEEEKALLQLEQYGIHISVRQNARFGLLAGSTAKMKQWIKEIAQPNQLAFRPMYPFPLHCSLMRPVADAILPFVKNFCNVEGLKTEIFSTVFGKVLRTEEEIISDCTFNISAVLDFPKAIEQVIAHYGAVNFVSIGPSNSLLKFLNCLELPENTEQCDYYLTSINKAA